MAPNRKLTKFLNHQMGNGPIGGQDSGKRLSVNTNMQQGFKCASVLVVDDDTDIAGLIEALLREMGVKHVDRAKNGKHAIGQLQRNVGRYDLVISDWNMPEVSGLELLKEIRHRSPNLPFLMLTGRSKKEEVLAAVKSGVSGYLSKPFAPLELQKQVLALCKRPEPSSEDKDFLEIC